ncbi:MAG: tRNA (N6-threonylcarbamoyladenosine(37)-N6)-methyltransferase TrmO [Candidatus Omnitrophica bacterium]|nr:tRNA (N6-threonylcarbamoyladenosine(37)-N6)-methyltransferase TrmO [Candidatus Omnitrophota bacterium]
MRLIPIGVIHTPFKCKKETPIQPFRSKVVGTVEVFKKYEEGLSDIEGFSHILLIYRFHKSRGYKLKTKPYLDKHERGIFASHYNRRPNQIGISIVKLIRRDKNRLIIKHVDMLDGTPLLDIKSYNPFFDLKKGIRVGWYKNVMKAVAHKDI